MGTGTSTTSTGENFNIMLSFCPFFWAWLLIETQILTRSHTHTCLYWGRTLDLLLPRKEVYPQGYNARDTIILSSPICTSCSTHSVNDETNEWEGMTWMSNIASGLTTYPVLSLMKDTTVSLAICFASFHSDWSSSLSANCRKFTYLT